MNKKFFGWLGVIIYTITVIIAAIVAVLQMFAALAVKQGMVIGYTSQLVAKHFPFYTLTYYAGYALCGIILLSMFHKWIFPEEHSAPTGNHYR